MRAWVDLSLAASQDGFREGGQGVGHEAGLRLRSRDRRQRVDPVRYSPVLPRRTCQWQPKALAIASNTLVRPALALIASSIRPPSASPWASTLTVTSTQTGRAV